MWANRNIRGVVLARAISRTGGEAAFFVGIWGRAAFDFDATPAALAVMMAVLGVMSMAGSAAAGVLVDRFGPRRVLMAAEVLFAPAALAPILATSMAELTVAVASMAFVGAIVYTAVASFPPYLAADEQQLATINGAMEVATTAAFIAGPALGAVLARYAGLEWIFVLDAVTSLVAVVAVLGVSTRAVAAGTQRRSAMRELRDGFRFAYGLPRLRFLLVLATVTWLSFGAFSALEPIFYREVLRTGPEALGVVNAIFGAGLALGAVVMARNAGRLLTIRTGALLTVAGGMGAVAYSGTSSVVVVAVGGFCWGTILGLLLPVMRTLLQTATPDHLQGRVMGVWSTHNTFGEMLPLLVVPGLAAVFGVQAVLVATGAVVVVVGLLCLPTARRMDRRVAPRDVTPGVVVAADAPEDPRKPAAAASRVR